MDEAWIREVLDILYEKPMGEAVRYAIPEGPVNEGFRIPAAVSFTAKGSNLYALGGAYHGTDSVASQILTYGYLWNTIRVQGGAYGTGLRMSLAGEALYSSFRDPSGNQSLEAYDRSPEVLREFCDSGEPLDKYIISTIGGQEPLMTPRMEGKRVLLWHFLGQMAEDRQRIRSEVLHTTADDLRRSADWLEEVSKHAGICVIGGAEILDACGDQLDRVEVLQK
ncbi:MAG: hypothetical protein IJH77_01325 [Mogibacterium sp.]|nr:hypothetical protein [Mogibacterium sp.]